MYYSTKREKEERQKRALALKIYNEISDEVKPSFFFDIHHQNEEEADDQNSSALEDVQIGVGEPKQINTPAFNESVETFSFGGMGSGQRSPGVQNSGELIINNQVNIKQSAIKLPSRFIKRIQQGGGGRFQHIKFRGE